MLLSLSAQEQVAVKEYNRRIRDGYTGNTELFADMFLVSVYDSVPQGGAFLDVGCGIGRFVPLLPILGITNYTGIDPAADQIAYCTKTYPQYRFFEMDMRALGIMFPDRFDAFAMISVIMHLPRGDLPQALRSLRGALKKGAHGLVSTPIGTGEGIGKTGLLCTLYQPDELEGHFSAAGFGIAMHRSHDHSMILSHVVAV